MSIADRPPVAVFPFHTLPLRSWATPVIIGAFFLMAATGVLMFFGWDLGLSGEAHEWFSWLFLAAAGAHIAANIRPFKNHLRSRSGKASIATFGAVLVASLAFAPVGGGQLRKVVEQSLVDAPLSTLASLTRTAPDRLALRLRAHGIAVNSQQTVRELARENHVSEMRVLAAVFRND